MSFIRVGVATTVTVGILTALLMVVLAALAVVAHEPSSSDSDASLACDAAIESTLVGAVVIDTNRADSGKADALWQKYYVYDGVKRVVFCARAGEDIALSATRHGAIAAALAPQ